MAAAEFLLDAQDGITGLAAAGGELLFSTFGTLSLLEPFTLSTRRLLTDARTYSVAADPMHAYWSSENLVDSAAGGIGRVPFAGGLPEAIVENQPVFTFRLAGDWVYWSNLAISDQLQFGPLQRAPKGGGAIDTVVDGPASMLTVTEADVYWADPDVKSVFRRSFATGLVGHLLDFPVVVNELLVVENVLYVALPSALWAHNLTTNETMELLAGNTGELTADGQAVYAALARRGVYRIVLGGEITQLADLPEANPGGLAVLGDYVYYGDFGDGAIWRIAK